MIYTVISSLKENGIEINKRDCRTIRQPQALLCRKMREYIDAGKNELHKAERRLAYITLLCALKGFYNIDAPNILINKHGKPYIKDCDVYFNISHSNGVAVVCLSDEGEIGIDLQRKIDPERADRLKERFFCDLKVNNEGVGAEYYYCNFSDDKVAICSISLPDFEPDTEDYSVKWVSAESIMKLTGRGFLDVDNVCYLSEKSKTEIKELNLDEKYYLAISVSK